MAVDREAGAGERGGAERAFVQPLDRVADAAQVAAEHLDIGHAVVAEGHRLRRLEMGEARHYRRRVRLGLVEEGGDQALQRLGGAGQLALRPEAEIDRHLVVARAGGVQPSGRRPDQLGKPRFHVHVDVLELGREDERSGLDF